MLGGGLARRGCRRRKSPADKEKAGPRGPAFLSGANHIPKDVYPLIQTLSIFLSL